MPYDEEGEFYADDSTPPAMLTFTIQGHEPAALADAVVAKIATDYHDKIRLWLEKRIDERVASLVSEAIVVKIEDHVEKLLDEGFQQTDLYGYKVGERKTVGQMILDALKPSSNSYGVKTLPAIISDSVRKDFDAEIKAATVRLRTIVDKEIGEQLNAALRSAVGLK